MKHSLNLGFSLLVLRAIALTAFTRDQDRKVAIDAGFNDRLAQPVNAAALFRKVAQVAARV